MSSFLFFIARLYPFIALSIAFIFFDLGKHFRRRKDKRQWAFFGICGFLIVSSILWFVFRGDVFAEKWLRELIGP